MSVETLRILSLVSYALGGVLLIAAVALFFVLKVPQLWGELSGKTERRAVENIRRRNVTEGSARTPAGKKEVSTTEKIGASAQKQEAFPVGETAKLSEETTVLSSANETTVLAPQSAETTVLAPETTLLSDISNETLAAPAFGNTADLSAAQPRPAAAPAAAPARVVPVVIEVEMGFTGSTELIL